MSFTSPSLSNTAATVAVTTPTAPSSQPSSPSGAMMPPYFVVSICASVLALSFISICMCRRLVSRRAFRPVSAYIPNARGRRRNDGDGDPANGRPEMFDAWAERCTLNSQKWEECMPLSVTVLTNAKAKRAPGHVRKVGGPRGDSAKEKRIGGKQDQGSRRVLQVSVLVAMPSQVLHTKTHDRVSESPLRDGLAIGLIEMPVD